MGELFGVPVSPGAVSRMVARITAAPGAPLEAIRQALTAADVAHLDETGFRVAGKLAWVHSASAGKFALITLHAKGGTQGIDAARVLPSVGGIAVHDAWAPYGTYQDLARHDLCNAHALRELQAVTDAAPEGQPVILRGDRMPGARSGPEWHCPHPAFLSIGNGAPRAGCTQWRKRHPCL